MGFRAERRIEDAVFTALAGHAAEAVLTGRHNWVGSSSDREHAFHLACCACGSDEEMNAYFELMWIRARQNIELLHHWVAVKALAEALLEERRIGYRRARQIVRAAWGGDIARASGDTRTTP